MPIFGSKGRLGYEITAEDKSRPAVESAKAGVQSLNKILSEIAKNTAATEAATVELSKSFKDLGSNASQEFQKLSENADRNFAVIGTAIAKAGLAFVTLRSTAVAVLGAVGKTFAVVAGAIASKELAQGFIEVAEASKRTEAQLKLVTGGGKEFVDVQKGILQTSRDLGQPLNQSIELYTNLGRGLKSAGVEYQRVLQVTESVGLALKASGASGESAAHGLRQLGQAFGAGVLRGDEFTSVLENVPRLAQAIADGLDIPIGKLRGLAEQGKLTSTVLLDALTSQTAKLRLEAEKIPVTIDQATTNLTTNIGIYIADIDRAIGFTEQLAGAINSVASALAGIREGISAFGGLIDSLGKGLDALGVGRGSIRDFVSGREQALRTDRGNQVPGGRSGAGRSGQGGSINDDSSLRQAQNRLENFDKTVKAEEAAVQKSLERQEEARKKSSTAQVKQKVEEIKTISEFEEEGLGRQLERINEERRAAKDSQVDKLADLRQSLLTEVELEDQRYQESLAIVEEAGRSELAIGISTAQELADTRQRIEADHQERIADIKEKEFEDQRRLQEENTRLIQQPFLNAIDGIQGSFSDAFVNIFSGGVNTFSELADTVKNIFIRLAAEIAALFLFKQVAGGLGQLLGGAGGLLGAAGAAGGAGGAGGLGSIFNLLGTGSSVSGAVGGPSLFSGLTGSINSFGGSLGFGQAAGFVGPPQAGVGALTSASLSSVLGFGGLGAAGGGLLAGALGGNSLVGTGAGAALGVAGGIGGTALAGSAAAAGSAFATGAALGSVVPVIGTIIGAVLGGVIGGAIKPTPPRGFQTVTVGGDVLAQEGKKGFDPEKALTPVTSGISSAILEIGRELGIGAERLKKINFGIGFAEGEGFSTEIRGRGNRSGLSQKQVETTVLQQELGLVGLGRDKVTDRILNRAFEKNTLEEAVKSAKADVKFRDDLQKILDPDEANLKALRKALGDIRKEFDTIRARAKELGIRTPGLNAIERERVRETRREFKEAELEFRRQFQEITADKDPRNAAIILADTTNQISAEFAQLRKRARELGIGLEGLAEAEQAAITAARDAQKAEAERAAAEKKLAEVQFRREFGELTGFADPRNNELILADSIEAIREQFEEVRKRAQELGLSLQGLDKAERDAIDRARQSTTIEIALRVIRDRIEEGLKAFQPSVEQQIRSQLLGRVGDIIGQLQSIREQSGVTGLQSFLNSLKTSDVLAPRARLEAARREFELTRRAAEGGDLGAVRRLPEVAQTLLGLARNAFASGPEFAKIFKSVNVSLDKILGRQKELFRIAEIDQAILENSREQVSAIKDQTGLLLQELRLIRKELGGSLGAQAAGQPVNLSPPVAVNLSPPVASSPTLGQQLANAITGGRAVGGGTVNSNPNLGQQLADQITGGRAVLAAVQRQTAMMDDQFTGLKREVRRLKAA